MRYFLVINTLTPLSEPFENKVMAKVGLWNIPEIFQEIYYYHHTFIVWVVTIPLFPSCYLSQRYQNSGLCHC